MKRWSWLLAITLSVSMLGFVGCEDSDDDGDDGGTTTSTTGGTTTTGGTATTGGTTTSNAPTGGTTPSATSIVLDEQSGIPMYAHGYSTSFTALTPTPAAGYVTLTVTWDGQDFDGNPADFNLSIDLGGAVRNDNAPSGISMSAGTGAGENWTYTLTNPNDGLLATAHARLVWHAN